MQANTMTIPVDTGDQYEVTSGSANTTRFSFQIVIADLISDVS